MRTSRPTLCGRHLAPGAVVVLLRLPTVHVAAGVAARQHIPALWPPGGVRLLWHLVSAPHRLIASENLLVLVGGHLRLALPADRRRPGVVVGAADSHRRPRFLSAVAHRDPLPVA